MMEMAKVTSKGQITIPISIRHRLKIKEGDKILFINKQDGVLMVNPDTVQGDLTELKASAVPLDAVVATPTAAVTSSAASVSGAPSGAGSAPTAPTAQPAQAAQPAKTAAAAPAPLSSTPSSVSFPTTPAEPIDPPRRKFIPPVEEPLDMPAANPKAGGLDLSTLLDDIRSIGSNI